MTGFQDSPGRTGSETAIRRSLFVTRIQPGGYLIDERSRVLARPLERGERTAYLRNHGVWPRRIRGVECGPKVGVGIFQYVVRFLGEPEGVFHERYNLPRYGVDSDVAPGFRCNRLGAGLSRKDRGSDHRSEERRVGK